MTSPLACAHDLETEHHLSDRCRVRQVTYATSAAGGQGAMPPLGYASLPLELREEIASKFICAAYEDASEPFWQETPILHDHLRNAHNSLAQYAHIAFLQELGTLQAALYPTDTRGMEMVRGLKLLATQVKADIDAMEEQRHARDWDSLCGWCRRLKWKPSWMQRTEVQWSALRELQLNSMWRVKVIADMLMEELQSEALVGDPLTNAAISNYAPSGPRSSCLRVWKLCRHLPGIRSLTHQLPTPGRLQPRSASSSIYEDRLSSSEPTEASQPYCTHHSAPVGLDASLRILVVAMRYKSQDQ